MNHAAQNDRILVTGGTGTLGRHVVAGLRTAGRDVRVLSRSARENTARIDYVQGDLLADTGVGAALDGARVVVHCAGGAKGDDVATANLVRAAARAGVEHLVHISVVGVDRVPVRSRIDRAMFGYFAAKLEAEHAVEQGGVPFTILRASQFHDLLFTVAQAMAKLPIIPVPSGFRFQPIDASEVATRLVELALGAPAGRVPDVAGPQVHGFGDLLRSYLDARGLRRWLTPMPLPGAAARAFRAGANLAPDRAVGRLTWEAFLASKLTQQLS